MTGPGQGALRVARALALAVSGTALAVGGHAAGGGHLELAPTLVVGAFAGVAFVVLAARRLTATAVVGGTVACQLAFHVLLSLEPAHGQAGGGVSAQMLAGHALATGLSSLLLLRGERLVWRVAALLSPALVVLLPAPPAPERATTVPACEDRDTRQRLLRGPGLLHRGPPAALPA